MAATEITATIANPTAILAFYQDMFAVYPQPFLSLKKLTLGVTEAPYNTNSWYRVSLHACLLKE